MVFTFVDNILDKVDRWIDRKAIWIGLRLLRSISVCVFLIVIALGIGYGGLIGRLGSSVLAIIILTLLMLEIFLIFGVSVYDAKLEWEDAEEEDVFKFLAKK